MNGYLLDTNVLSETSRDFAHALAPWDSKCSRMQPLTEALFFHGLCQGDASLVEGLLL